MNINKILLRFYPPGAGIALSYQTANGEQYLEHIDLLDLDMNSKPSEVAKSILSEYHKRIQKIICEGATNRKTLEADTSPASLTLSRATSTTSDIQNVATNNIINKLDTTPDNNQTNNFSRMLRKAVAKLQRKIQEPTKKKFYQQTRLEAHILPLTNAAFDRSGEHCLTGSYDRTCRIIDTRKGTEEHVLAEHDNVVFSVAYNFPKW